MMMMKSRGNLSSAPSPCPRSVALATVAHVQYLGGFYFPIPSTIPFPSGRLFYSIRHIVIETSFGCNIHFLN